MSFSPTILMHLFHIYIFFKWSGKRYQTVLNGFLVFWNGVRKISGKKTLKENEKFLRVKKPRVCLVSGWCGTPKPRKLKRTLNSLTGLDLKVLCQLKRLFIQYFVLLLIFNDALGITRPEDFLADCQTRIFNRMDPVRIYILQFRKKLNLKFEGWDSAIRVY